MVLYAQNNPRLHIYANRRRLHICVWQECRATAARGWVINNYGQLPTTIQSTLCAYYCYVPRHPVHQSKSPGQCYCLSGTWLLLPPPPPLTWASTTTVRFIPLPPSVNVASFLVFYATGLLCCTAYTIMLGYKGWARGRRWRQQRKTTVNFSLHLIY